MNKLKLMIVDDSFVIRTVITSAHNRDKYEIVALANNGEDAVEKFKLHTPQIVTMDLTMPKMDGLACIKELLKLDPNVQIVVVSALKDEATGIKALKLGAAGFINKPFTEEEVSEAIDIVAAYL